MKTLKPQCTMLSTLNFSCNITVPSLLRNWLFLKSISREWESIKKGGLNEYGLSGKSSWNKVP